MRPEVIAAVRSLSDQVHQQARWGRWEDGVDYYDDLTMNVHILYDDCMVLPRPQDAVPTVLHEQEIPIFLDLERALGPMIRDLGSNLTTPIRAIDAGSTSSRRPGGRWL